MFKEFNTYRIMWKLLVSSIALTSLLWNIRKRKKIYNKSLCASLNNEIIPCPIPLNICIHGNHWNIAYQLGVASALKEFLYLEDIHFYGSSFGSLISTAMHLELSLNELLQFVKTYSNTYSGFSFIWNFQNLYSDFIDRYFKSNKNPPPSYLFTPLSFKKSKWVEVSLPNYSDILKYTYSFPFPLCIPKQINKYGYLWNISNVNSSDYLEISTNIKSTIPPPMRLQYVNLYSSDKIDELYRIGYLRGFIKLHLNSEWIPYFKESPKIKNIKKCLDYLQEIDTLVEKVI